MGKPETIIVRPTREGLKVRLSYDPNRTVPPKGCRVQNNTYFQRRIADGDLEIVKPAPAVKKKATPKPPKADN